MKPLPSAPTGYLAQVVERVLPTEPTLRRRQPSLFEAAQPGDGVCLQDTVDESRSASQSAGRREVAPIAPPPRAQRAEAMPPPPASAPARPAPVVASEATIRAPAPPPGAVPAALKQEPTVRREPPVVDASVRVVTVSLPPHAAAIPVPTQAAALATVAAERRTDTPRTVEPAERRAAATATEGAAAERAHRPASPPADVPPPVRRDRHTEAAAAVAQQLRPTVQPTQPWRAALRAAAQAAARTVGPQAATELPPVEVTIGRVEVRAVAAPPGTPRSQRSAPRLSLEKYLRDRNGGGR